MIDEVDDDPRFVTFAGSTRVGGGTLAEAAAAAKRATEGDGGASVLVFDAVSGAVRDLDLRGHEAEVVARYASSASARRGRPKLGVTAREVTLLPRHWDWLAAQPGGASVALRKLVEAARKQDEPASDDRVRREAAYRFMAAMAGDRPGFEEAARALFAGERDRLAWFSRAWPADVRGQLFRYLDGER
jgi:hypothetical protein